MNDIQDVAKRIVDNLRQQYSAPTNFVPVKASEMKHLDLAAYNSAGAAFERHGFHFIADLEIPEVTNAPNTTIARTMIRFYVSDDGICGTYYQIKPRIDRLLKLLFKGIINFRWIAAPRFFLKSLSTKHCIGFESELSDGSYINTSNAEAAGMISNPPSIDAQFFPYDTKLNRLLKHQRKRLQTKLLQPSITATPLMTLDHVLQMEQRQKAEKNAYRATVGWVSQAELLAMAGNNAEIADAVFAEVKKLLGDKTTKKN